MLPLEPRHHLLLLERNLVRGQGGLSFPQIGCRMKLVQATAIFLSMKSLLMHICTCACVNPAAQNQPDPYSTWVRSREVTRMAALLLQPIWVGCDEEG